MAHGSRPQRTGNKGAITRAVDSPTATAGKALKESTGKKKAASRPRIGRGQENEGNCY
jgi:hypothetical protein